MENTSIPPSAMQSFDEHMKSHQKGGQQDHDGKPPSPTNFQYNFDGIGASSSFFRPPVWTGAGNAADGLLGCQAPAADGLDESFGIYPPEPEPLFEQLLSLPDEQAAGSGGHLPRLPIEIHLQILSYVLPSFQARGCSFCNLFQLSTLSKVSRLYNSLLQPYLYHTLNLNFNSSLDSRSSLIHQHDDSGEICSSHIALASRHQQLELRVPLLLRTLSSRRDIAESVQTILLPSGGTTTYLTCTLEKTLLPALIRSCPNLSNITGVDGLLSRQFFSGEHYCLDDGADPQQHGILAKTLHETKTLRRWVWNGGSAGGGDFASRMWDRNPVMEGVCFVGTHQNWGNLEHLEIRNVWNIDSTMLSRLIPAISGLRRIALVGVRKKRGGRGDARVILDALEVLPASVREVEVGNTDDEGFVADVGEWVRIRHTVKEFSMLESLRITQTPITAEKLDDFFAKISVRKMVGFERVYLPLLDFGMRWRAVVKCLAVDNSGFEGLFGGERKGVWEEGRMEMAGLQELEWRVGGDEGKYMGSRLRSGWFGDLKRVVGDRESVMVARERGVVDTCIC
ncbi:hypothetical protein K440DRAFT_659308 [Wilcoxina mikolae CBS 423.85]|nr:hypothetical protein K440DRAFT_659308 [Wilcoxina mikolae CBS 423.85]